MRYSCFFYQLQFSEFISLMSNMAGRERDQLGTKVSAGLDWSLGRMPLPFSTSEEGHALQQKSAM